MPIPNSQGFDEAIGGRRSRISQDGQMVDSFGFDGNVFKIESTPFSFSGGKLIGSGPSVSEEFNFNSGLDTGMLEDRLSSFSSGAESASETALEAKQVAESALAEIESLKSEVSGLTDSSTEVDTRLIVLEDIDIDAMQADLTAANASIISLEADLVTANAAITTLQTNLATANTAIAANASAITANEGEITNLWAAIA